MPSAPVTDSAYVPSEKQVMKIALDQSINLALRDEAPGEKLRRIENEARTIAEQTGSPYPQGVHKIER